MTRHDRATLWQTVVVIGFIAVTAFNSYTLSRIERHTDQRMEVRIYPAKPASVKARNVPHGANYLPPADYVMAIPADWALSLAPKGKKLR